MIKNLEKLKADLPTGGLWKLAKRLKCDPSKITRAFDGLVKSDDFMQRLEAEAIEIIKEGKQSQKTVKAKRRAKVS